MKKMLVGMILFLGLASISRAEWCQEPGARFSAGFTAGFVIGSLSEIIHSANQDYEDEQIEAKLTDFDKAIRRAQIHAGWGIIGGILIETTRCSNFENTSFEWEALRWGLLGGLTSITVKF